MSVVRAPLVFSSMILASLLGFTACDQAADCAAVCTRYQTCFDDEYDVAACKSRCNERSDDEDFRARTNECDACIDERDCIDTVFACGSECSAVIDE